MQSSMTGFLKRSEHPLPGLIESHRYGFHSLDPSVPVRYGIPFTILGWLNPFLRMHSLSTPTDTS